MLVHTGERPFNCRYCHLTFTTNGNMHRHMRTHKQHQVAQSQSQSQQQQSLQQQQQSQQQRRQQQQHQPSQQQQNPAQQQLMGNTLSARAESYESDASCSTDVSSGHSHSRSSSSLNNNNNNSHKANNNLKDLEELEVSTEDQDTENKQRRLKTTINNNIIESEQQEDMDDEEADDADVAMLTSTPDVATLLAGASASGAASRSPTPSPSASPALLLSCPACGASDFETLPALCVHLDAMHSDIPAKCRDCEVIFATHRQLQSHCCRLPNALAGGLPPLLGASSSPLHNEEPEDEEHGDDEDLEQKERLASQSEDFFHQLYLKHKTANGCGAISHPPSPIKHEPADTKDLADIQSILNMTSSSSSFLRNFEQSVNTPNSSQYSLDGRDQEEEAQDAFTSEFRRMKLRGEFPASCARPFFRTFVPSKVTIGYIWVQWVQPDPFAATCVPTPFATRPPWCVTCVPTTEIVRTSAPCATMPSPPRRTVNVI